jgi:hypothetical protein
MTFTILNLTQHSATPDQVAAGVVDLPEDRRAALSKALTVSEEELVICDDELFEDLMQGRVSRIIALIWQDIVQAKREQCADALQEENNFDFWHVSRQPLFRAMVGGAPYLVERLNRRLREHGVTPVYATSARKSVEVTNPDGSVTKTQVFAHLGFRKAL